MINPIIRQLKIDLITDTLNPILEWFDSIWIQLCVIESNVYHKDGGEFIYYIDGDKKQWIFYQDDKNERFLCNDSLYWLIFENKFDLKYSDVQALTKIMVETALNNMVFPPVCLKFTSLTKVETALNIMVFPPAKIAGCNEIVVETALNNMVFPPKF